MQQVARIRYLYGIRRAGGPNKSALATALSRKGQVGMTCFMAHSDPERVLTQQKGVLSLASQRLRLEANTKRETK